MAGIYVPWLADAAYMTGYPVVEVPDWRTRGNGGYRALEGLVGHHTATPEYITGDYPSLRIVRDGREGLWGLLGNLGLGRSGTIYVIGAGVAYHAGVSAWNGFFDLNDEYIGIEAEDSGDGHWTPLMVDCYPRLAAAVLHYMRRGADRYCGHLECALPLGRKIDPKAAPDGTISGPWMRQRIATYLATPSSINRFWRPPSAEPLLAVPSYVHGR